MADLIGMDLGRYHILEPLGEGGMASVYKAYDTRLEREVALKVIRTDQFAPALLESILKRFDREAKALARLSHSNIVGVIDYGEYNGTPYLVMEYLPGGTLKGRIGKPIPWQEAARLLLPIARALDFAHRQGMAHRDVKPSNILVTADGDPMLTDFGIAKILDVEAGQTLTGTGVGIGTPEYMAPEQWVGRVAAQSDIYSLGVVFYEMITRRKPYSADTPAAVLIKQTNDPLPRPAQFVPSLPEAVEKVLFKALAKQPEDRYPSMADFATALDGLIKMGSDLKIGKRKTENIKKESSEERTETRNKSTPIPIQTEVTRDEQTIPATQPPPVPEGPVGSLKHIFFRKYWLIGAIVLGLAVLGSLGKLLLKKDAGLFPTQTSTNTQSPTITLIPTDTLTFTPTFTPVYTATPTFTLTPALAIGSTWTRPADGMLMLYVPAGDFKMGSPEGTGESDEHPQHTLSLQAFWIDKTDVTNAMYAVCVKAGACQPLHGTSSNTRPSYYGNPGYDDYPVIYLDWNQAKTYCEWAGARLPTEAEWEKAARGTDGRTYPWGNTSPTCLLANYSGCKGDTSTVNAHASGASPYGALDMAGNVWQWVADWYGETYYSQSPQSNPQGPTSGSARVLRGGAWDFNSYYIRSAARYGYSPASSYFYIGFRCSRSLP